MNGNLGYAQILERDVRLENDQKQAVERISQCGNHLLELINDILDFSKIEAGRMDLNVTAFTLDDLADNLSAIFELKCQEKELQWVAEGFSGRSQAVAGDLGKIRQVLFNLVGNAIKFTDSGSITLFLKDLGSHWFEFSVTDTGPGIAATAKRRLFESFYQGAEGTRHGGTGLGLSIAKSQIELMGGRLAVESELKKGSRFYFTIHLPPAKVLEKKDIPREVERIKDGFSVRALVVDDVDVNREVLCALLTEIGAETYEASDGFGALDLIQREDPDIVFMDIRMPGMDGSSAIQQLRANSDTTKVVATTAFAFSGEKERLLKQGFDSFIAKPFRPNDIYKALENLLKTEFKYRSDSFAEEAEAPNDFSKFRISSDLQHRLLSAAQMYQTTEIKRCLNELLENTHSNQALVDHMASLSKDLKMDQLVTIVKELQVE
jgi:CheY-like chemotaxis protein/anti-sigma regulatory factor (Ser/Thr protein kinase)